MTRAVRSWVLALGVAATGAVLLVAVLGLPSFGAHRHPYRDAAVEAAVAHGTANAVSSVNFDQRGLDTLGEESILFGSVLAVATLLRPSEGERLTRRAEGDRPSLEGTRLFGYLLLPLTLLVGLDVVAHGHVTPGGGFQGGILLATGLHLLYVAGRYRSLEQLRPLPVFETAEAGGTAAFAVVGLAGTVLTGSFLADVLPSGRFTELLSAGTVPLLNVAVGIAVGSGGVVLLAQFFRQAFLVERSEGQA